MKNISLLILTVLFLFSCEKSPTEKFDDFDYTTVYFPFQYPVRTLILGDYSSDNTNDNNLKFLISGRVGGLYENKSNRNVSYQLDPSLVNNLSTNPNSWDGKVRPSSDTLEILPSQYYTLNPTSSFVIPKGKFYGEIEVQLTEAFLDDPKAFSTNYVIPIRITSTSADSVLSGIPVGAGADRRIAAQWSILPKDFTLFAIKFVNPYHGKYLHRGKSVITNETGDLVETIVYHKQYVEQDELWSLQTSGRNKVYVTGTLRATPSSPGNFKMDLTFNANGDCIISTSDGSAFPVTGTGKFIKNGDEWGNVPRNAIHLNYKVTEGTNIHTISDTLVFRDKGIVFQEYQPVIIP